MEPRGGVVGGARRVVAPALVLVALVASVAVGGPASAQEVVRRPSQAFAIFERPEGGPLAGRVLNASPDGYLTLSFVDASTLARPELDVVAVLTPLPAADAARTVTEKRGDTITARTQRYRSGAWEDVGVGEARQVSPSAIEVPTPVYATANRDDAVYVTVNVPADPALGTWRSPPFYMRDLLPATGGSAGLSPWAWVDPPGGGAPQRVADPSAPVLQAQSTSVRLVEPPAPTEVGGRAVRDVVDRVLVRPAGMVDASAPLELRADPRTLEVAAFVAGTEQPLPAPPGSVAGPVPEGGGRWGAEDYWRATPVAGERAFVFDTATLESVFGQPISAGALVGLARTVEFEDGSTSFFEGTDALLPSGLTTPASGKDGSEALRDLGIGPATVPPPATPASGDRLTATIVLAVGGTLLVAAIAFWVGRAVTGSAWWRHRRHHRRS